MAEDRSILYEEKQREEVIVYLTDNLAVVGTVHRHPNQRLSDLVNRVDQMFVPLTNAKVYNNCNAPMTELAFLAINKRRIAFITSPTEKLQEALFANDPVEA